MADTRCAVAGCHRRPSFGYLAFPGSRFCGVHMEPDMVDTCTGRCSIDGCARRAMFGVRDSYRLLYCGRHRPPNAVVLDARADTDDRADASVMKIHRSSFRCANDARRIRMRKVKIRSVNNRACRKWEALLTCANAARIMAMCPNTVVSVKF